MPKIFILKDRFAHVQRLLELACATHGIALMTASRMNRAIYPGCLMATGDFVCVARQVAGIRPCAMRTEGRADSLCTKLRKPRGTTQPTAVFDEILMRTCVSFLWRQSYIFICREVDHLLLLELFCLYQNYVDF